MCPHVTKTNEVGRKDNYAHKIAAMNEIHKTAATSEDYFLPVRFYFVVQANFRFSITALNSGEHNELLFVLSRYEMDLHSMK